ncbi:MAG: DUF2304 domain-containing protein [Candidatus Riflebacteria bacterium HGW-Riflebacteria-2]|jgi:hypothetical protein|nr:MAG: DUF2304 domain-containing protein [Candidatus Riflebacteria bacterium HGW-Riflebacteria-2]
MLENLERIQIISIIGSIFFLFLISKLIRKNMLKEAYAILWLLFGSVFLLFSCWKKGLDYFASIFGIYYPPALLFLILIMALILVLIQFSIVVSSQNDKIRLLTQEVALLKNELDKTQQKNSPQASA